jgi:hypothetical protein
MHDSKHERLLGGESGRRKSVKNQCVVSCRQRHILILSALLPKGVIQVYLGTPLSCLKGATLGH